MYEIDDDTNKPQINYDAAALCIPGLLFGTVIGVTLNRVIPELILLFLLTALILMVLFKIFRKA